MFYVDRMSTMLQYVVVRGDLMKTKEWPVGAVIAQACHACTAVIHLFYNDSDTQTYLADLDAMHKVVLEVSTDRNSTGLYSVQICAYSYAIKELKHGIIYKY